MIGGRIFISHSRSDRKMAFAFRRALEAQGLEVHGDWELKPRPEYWTELERLINAAHAVLFIMSPRSITSPNCARECSLASSHLKLIIPVRYKDGYDVSLLPIELTVPQWLTVRSVDDVTQAGALVAEAISTDFELMDRHVLLHDRADEWCRAGRRKSLLLRGVDLFEAEEWLAKVEGSPEKRPNATANQREYIFASRRDFDRGKRFRLGAGVAALALLAVLGVWTASNALAKNVALSERNDALQRALIAQRDKLDAEKQRANALAVAKNAQAKELKESEAKRIALDKARRSELGRTRAEAARKLVEVERGKAAALAALNNERAKSESRGRVANRMALLGERALENDDATRALAIAFAANQQSPVPAVDRLVGRALLALPAARTISVYRGTSDDRSHYDPVKRPGLRKLAFLHGKNVLVALRPSGQLSVFRADDGRCTFERSLLRDLVVHLQAPVGITALLANGSLQFIKIDFDGACHPSMPTGRGYTGVAGMGNEEAAIAWTNGGELRWLRGPHQGVVRTFPFLRGAVAVGTGIRAPTVVLRRDHHVFVIPTPDSAPAFVGIAPNIHEPRFESLREPFVHIYESGRAALIGEKELWEMDTQTAVGLLDLRSLQWAWSHAERSTMGVDLAQGKICFANDREVRQYQVTQGQRGLSVEHLENWPLKAGSPAGVPAEVLYGPVGEYLLTLSAAHFLMVADGYPLAHPMIWYANPLTDPRSGEPHQGRILGSPELPAVNGAFSEEGDCLALFTSDGILSVRHIFPETGIHGGLQAERAWAGTHHVPESTVSYLASSRPMVDRLGSIQREYSIRLTATEVSALQKEVANSPGSLQEEVLTHRYTGMALHVVHPRSGGRFHLRLPPLASEDPRLYDGLHPPGPLNELAADLDRGRQVSLGESRQRYLTALSKDPLLASGVAAANIARRRGTTLSDAECVVLAFSGDTQYLPLLRRQRGAVALWAAKFLVSEGRDLRIDGPLAVPPKNNPEFRLLFSVPKGFLDDDQLWVIMQRPPDDRARCWLTRAVDELGRASLSVAALRAHFCVDQGDTDDGPDPANFRLFGCLLERDGNRKAGALWLRRAPTIEATQDLNMPEAWVKLLLRMDLPKEAANATRQIAELGRDPELLWRLAETHWLEGSHEEALALAAGTLALNPSEPLRATVVETSRAWDLQVFGSTPQQSREKLHMGSELFSSRPLSSALDLERNISGYRVLFAEPIPEVSDVGSDSDPLVIQKWGAVAIQHSRSDPGLIYVCRRFGAISNGAIRLYEDSPNRWRLVVSSAPVYEVARRLRDVIDPTIELDGEAFATPLEHVDVCLPKDELRKNLNTLLARAQNPRSEQIPIVNVRLTTEVADSVQRAIANEGLQGMITIGPEGFSIYGQPSEIDRSRDFVKEQIDTPPRLYWLGALEIKLLPKRDDSVASRQLLEASGRVARATEELAELARSLTFDTDYATEQQTGVRCRRGYLEFIPPNKATEPQARDEFASNSATQLARVLLRSGSNATPIDLAELVRDNLGGFLRFRRGGDEPDFGTFLEQRLKLSEKDPIPIMTGMNELLAQPVAVQDTDPLTPSIFAEAGWPIHGPQYEARLAAASKALTQDIDALLLDAFQAWIEQSLTSRYAALDIRVRHSIPRQVELPMVPPATATKAAGLLTDLLTMPQLRMVSPALEDAVNALEAGTWPQEQINGDLRWHLNRARLVSAGWKRSLSRSRDDTKEIDFDVFTLVRAVSLRELRRDELWPGGR